MTEAATRPAVAARAARPKGRKARRSGAERWLHALDVLARALAAIVGGYAATALTTAALARILPGRVEEATIGVTTFSFVVYAAVAIWAFADARAWRVWAGLLALCGVLGGVLLWSLSVEPRL